MDGRNFWGCLPRTGEGALEGADQCAQVDGMSDPEETWFNALTGACETDPRINVSCAINQATSTHVVTYTLYGFACKAP